MSEFNRRLSIPDTKAEEQAAVAAALRAAAPAGSGGGGHTLFSSSQPDGHGRILPPAPLRPLEQLIPLSSNNARVSDLDRLLPPMGATFPLPFLSSGRRSMNPPSLNVLGSPIPLLSSLSEASKQSPREQHPPQLKQQHQMALAVLPTSGTNTLESKAELYDRIREQARLQTLAEASHLFEPGGALSVAAAGGVGGGAPSTSTSQNLPLMLENIRALVNPAGTTNIQVDTTVQEKLKMMEEAYRKQQQPQVKKPSGTLVVLPLKENDRRASFPMPSLKRRSAPGMRPVLSLSNCQQKWNELQQRTSDPTKTPIPMPDAFVREFFARSLHDKNTHQGRLHNKVRQLLLLRIQQQAAACAASRSSNDDGTGGSEDCGSSTSEPLKKRLKRSYAASR